MQEQAHLGPPCVVVKIAIVSSSALALVSIACQVLARYLLDPNGNLFAVFWPTDSNIDATNDIHDTREHRTLFLSQAKFFDCLWYSQIPVSIACISLAGHGHWSFALALAVHQTLFQRLHLVKKWEPGRRKLWHAAAGSGLALGLLIASVFLAGRGTMPVPAAKSLPLSVVTLVHVWSISECVATLRPLVVSRWRARAAQIRLEDQTYQQQSRAAILLFSGILAFSVSSLACWAALLVDDYRTFLATVYFMCVPAELVLSGDALWKCRVRRRRGRNTGPRLQQGNGSHPGEQDSDPRGADLQAETHNGLDSGYAASTVGLVNESSSGDSSLHRVFGVGPGGLGSGFQASGGS